MHIGFISKGRCVGRTYLMVADSVIRGTPIVCADKKRCKNLSNFAKHYILGVPNLYYVDKEEHKLVKFKEIEE